jgi:2'-5' RNA ligase
MRNLKFYLMESKQEKKLGCAMLYFKAPQMDIIHSKISEDDIYISEDDYGLETEPHCTLLYGFHDLEVQGDEVLDFISDFEIPKTLILDKISLFQNEKFDVLKFDIKNDKLTTINNHLTSNFPYSTDYPIYNAHCTIAYLKKGMGQKYVDKFKSNFIEVQSEMLVYSNHNREKIYRPL